MSTITVASQKVTLISYWPQITNWTIVTSKKTDILFSIFKEKKNNFNFQNSNCKSNININISSLYELYSFVSK